MHQMEASCREDEKEGEVEVEVEATGPCPAQEAANAAPDICLTHVDSAAAFRLALAPSSLARTRITAEMSPPPPLPVTVVAVAVAGSFPCMRMATL